MQETKMKSKNLFLSFIVILLMTSCSGFYFTDNESTADVSHKTSLQNFSILYDPIVYSIPVYEQVNLLGIKNFLPKSKRAGDIIVVLDTESASIFDWCFIKNSGFLNYRSVEVKTENNHKYYFSTNDGSQYYLDACTGLIEKIKSSGKIYEFDIYNTQGKYTLFVSYGYDSEVNKEKYIIHLFDTENETFQNPLEIITDSINVGHPKSDNNGNFYFSYKLDDKYFICMINSAENKTELLPLSLNATDSEKKESCYYYVSYISDEYIYVLKNWVGTSYTQKPSILMINKNTMDKIETELKCPDTGNGTQLYFYESQLIGNYFYTTLNNSNSEKSSIIRYDINSSDKTPEIIVEELNFSFTNNFWYKNSKLFFMNSWNINQSPYMYVDLITNKCSQIYYFDVDKKNYVDEFLN